jgi:CRISPR-associated protein Cas1
MIKRTLEISDGPTFLHIEDDQLVLERNRQEIGRVPAEDVGVLIVDHHSTTYTQGVLVRLLHHGAAVIVCGPDHLPAGILLGFEQSSLVAQTVRLQAQAKLPLKKRLWRQIIQHKIRGQARNMPADDPATGIMLELARTVKSGDPANCEGQAARLYWPAMFGEAFRRDRDGLPPNNLLNYGYMVMRAAVARAAVSAGLSPAMGLHHQNRANAFCLADDLVEVLRPMVDKVVVDLYVKGRLEMHQEAKAAILGLLTREISVGGQKGPLMVALHRIIASLVRCLQLAQDRLDLPDQ